MPEQNIPSLEKVDQNNELKPLDNPEEIWSILDQQDFEWRLDSNSINAIKQAWLTIKIEQNQLRAYAPEGTNLSSMDWLKTSLLKLHQLIKFNYQKIE